MTCPVEGVQFEIFNLDILPVESPTVAKTDENGDYALDFNEADMYTIKQKYMNHVFVDSMIAVYVGDLVEIPNVNFIDTLTRVISGVVKAGCE